MPFRLINSRRRATACPPCPARAYLKCTLPPCRRIKICSPSSASRSPPPRTSPPTRSSRSLSASSASTAAAAYGSEQETIARFSIFKDTLATIEARNAVGKEKHGVTKFADLTPASSRRSTPGWRRRRRRCRRNSTPCRATPPARRRSTGAPRARALQSRTRGSAAAAGPSRRRSSSIGLLPHLRHAEDLAPQIVSCDTDTNGCGGGNPINAWQYLNTFGGQEPSRTTRTSRARPSRRGRARARRRR